jgi:acetylornithine deacetylase/succinyl-diaminopimelate desuccinylase-like protein
LIVVSFVSFVFIQRSTEAQSTVDATSLLQQYIRIDSSNPPGDTTRAADFLESLLKRDGIAVTRYESAPGKAIVLARLTATRTPAAGKPIVLLQHMDVVPADRAQWKVDPFAGILRDNAIWGRGAVDMKGPAIAQALAFIRLKREAVPLARDVILLAEPDEEIGGAGGARWMIQHHYAEIDPGDILDEGGFASDDLFAPGKQVYTVAVAEKKLIWLTVRAEGTAGHGSQPSDANPNDRLTRGLARLLASESADAAPAAELPPATRALLATMKTRVGTFAANKFTNAMQRSTVAITWMRSGVGEPPKQNVIPSVAEAGLDCRVLPGITRDQWLADIRRRLGDDSLAVRVVSEGDDAVVSRTETPVFRALERAILQRHPGAIVTPALIPFTTDANSFRPRGVNGYGIVPVPLPADLISQMHGDAERIPIGAVEEAAGVLFEALKDALRP